MRERRDKGEILAKRLNPFIQDTGLEEQCGFLNDKGCADALFTLKSALFTRYKHNLQTYALFVDLVKAFNTVNHELLWKILQKYGVLNDLVNVIIRLYENFHLIYKNRSAEEFIKYIIGVHQGNNLAPLLFNLFFQAAIDSLKKNG